MSVIKYLSAHRVGLSLFVVGLIAISSFCLAWRFYSTTLLDWESSWAWDLLERNDSVYTDRVAALGQVGDFFGGLLNPILSTLAFCALLYTLTIQRRQSRDGQLHLAQATRATDLESYLRVHGLLQSKDMVLARGRLYEFKRRIDVAEAAGPSASMANQFNEHSHPAEYAAGREAAETIGREFELVGLLIEGGLLSHELLLRTWSKTIVKCWDSSEPVVKKRRKLQDDDMFWSRFEQLANLAKTVPNFPAPENLGITTI